MKTELKADNNALPDREEPISAMEPLLVGSTSRRRHEIADLVLELTARSTGFRKSLPDGIVRSLSDLVRSMNCYYSNLIEGHDTHPIDIERALNADYSQNQEKRDLQLEARAHIHVQAWIDGGSLDGRTLTTNALLEIHKRFCEALPAKFLMVSDPETGKQLEVRPGELRTRDVQVGRHIAVSPGALPRFLNRFDEGYRGLGKIDAIMAAASAHHRLLWLHPFLDGNGRVARLLSYAVLRETLDTGGIWSVARGLARNESAYKAHLANCDLPRRNDLDGRGSLSEEMLADFTKFFMQTCIDQVDFMERLVQPEKLSDRILLWAEGEIRRGIFSEKAKIVLKALLFRGELARGEIAGLLATGDRNARRITASLIETGVLRAETSKAPLKLVFPASLADTWMPGLFPAKAD